MLDDFAAFILTHGRANNVITAKTLKDCGYTGKLYFVIDDEDEQEGEYKKIYGDKVLKFSKKKIAETFDTMDTQQDRRTIVYARNACFELAQKVGVRYFLELDDDYTDFQMRYAENGKMKGKKIKNLDEVFEIYLDFLKDTNAVTVAMAQGGDFIGGCKSGTFQKGVLRKAMNSFFCDVEKPFQFVGRINEDVNTYTSLGSVGELMLTAVDAMLTQKTTQKNKGGMSDVYNASGTYLKSFYSVMIMPSVVTVQEMGDKHRRIHHNVEWDYCVPKILNEKWKKGG